MMQLIKTGICFNISILLLQIYLIKKCVSHLIHSTKPLTQVIIMKYLFSNFKILEFCFFKNKYIFSFYVYGCFACMYICALCVLSTQGGHNRASDPGTGVIDCWQMPCKCWESNL